MNRANSSSHKRDFVFVTGAFILSRATLFVLIFAARLLLPERAPNAHKDFVAFPNNLVLDSLCRWDSGWYHRIAEHGYFIAGSQNDVAFFPAFPYLARWVGRIWRSDFAGGLVVTHVALYFGLFFLLGIARRHLDENGARRAVILALLFPSSFFFSCFYTEGLFFFAAAGALYFYERDELLYAGLFGALAASTRLAGTLLLPSLLIGALVRNRFRPKATMAWLFVTLAGLGLVMVVLKAQVGDPLIFVKAQAGWGRVPTFPLTTLYREYRAIDKTANGAFIAIDLLAAIGALIGALYALARIDVGHGLFVIGSVLLPLASGRMMAVERYVLCAVPLYVVLGRATANTHVERAVFVTFAMSLALHTTLFANWYWAG